MSKTKNKMSDLRNHLFEALERLNDMAATNELKMGMELDRAKAISEVAQVIINSAKVEVEYLKATDRQSASEFLAAEETPQLPQNVTPQKGLSTGKYLGHQAIEVVSHANGNGREPA